MIVKFDFFIFIQHHEFIKKLSIDISDVLDRWFMPLPYQNKDVDVDD